ncbi:hypothetical protein [Virgisporangium aurantiacum]|uniref:Uncharacterized protein n=1 Tax=Virgisporangium aurantiacum TaxID=175570 RepID=A0A8J3ZJX1_9ACTN|nr:hypothetical protein [Virgisporangium aurantiacum]GIJ64312.1 hypothetical protein Vau01_118280 [Virgisporangium aurantiacum]
MAERGAYFLANDGILNLATTFLNSFRVYNRSLPLCLIPYGDDIDDLSRLADRYGFTIWPDGDRLRWCDDISRMFHGRRVGQYRKLALWDGPFDEFVYIDCDTVVLANVGFVFDHLRGNDFVTSFSHVPETRRWVWKDTIHGTGALADDQIAYAASTGFVASRRGCLAPADVDTRLPAALALADHMELLCCEQPLLNYLIVTSGRPYTSLHTIATDSGAWNIPMERWAGDPSYVVRAGRVVRPQSPTLMVHWAGEWQRARQENRPIPYADLWNYYSDPA